MTTILIVDDEPDIRALLRFVLERVNFTVLEAGNGAEALALCVDHTPDLVLTDLLMPKISGAAMLQHMMDKGHDQQSHRDVRWQLRRRPKFRGFKSQGHRRMRDDRKTFRSGGRGQTVFRGDRKSVTNMIDRVPHRHGSMDECPLSRYNSAPYEKLSV